MTHSLNSTIVALLLLVVQCMCISNPIYIISNAEAPSLNRPGFTPIGKQRAEECIPPIFKDKNIGKIISCLPDKDSGLCSQTVDTATPLANYLGLEVDTSCGAGEESNDDCVGDLMKSFSKTSDKGIVIVWDLQGMDDLFENIDADYPDIENENDDDDEGGEDDAVTTNFDLITTVNHSVITSVESQNCTGIDGPARDTNDRRRAIRRRVGVIIETRRMESHSKMVMRRKMAF
ncbi:hypothetical protein BDQ17DRAFT_1425699 [Cyathus striatus]|nr:hypothetical protein BDQ17DRAFT_1425699 [Cyathus striatus]